MDILERLNRFIGTKYEGLFGGLEGANAELRPKDILRRILSAMEDNRREGLDGVVYVPNAYTLRIAVRSDAERDYLKSFLSAEELAGAVARRIGEHRYKTRGDLSFVIEEMEHADPSKERVEIVCRFDATVTRPAPVAATPTPVAPQPVAPQAAPDEEILDDEPGTVPALPDGAGGVVLATLLVRSGDGRSLEAVPVGMRGATIGRSRNSGNDIVLTDSQVSKRHGRMDWTGAAFTYTDENSTNGSCINDAPVTPSRAHPFSFGDVLRVGESTITLRPAGNHQPVPSSPLPLVGVSLIAPDGESLPLASEMIGGRGATADVLLRGANLSPRHVRFRRDPSGTLTVEDLDTPGGTFVSGRRIAPGEPMPLRNGDTLTFGGGAAYTVRIG